MFVEPNYQAPTKYRRADEAVAELIRRYQTSIDHLQNQLKIRLAKTKSRANNDELQSLARCRAYYPFVRIQGKPIKESPSDQFRLHSFGFLADQGRFETSITKPELFKSYLHEQFERLLSNHVLEIEVGMSNQSIPLHFALGDEGLIGSVLDHHELSVLRSCFDHPDLRQMDDAIANGCYQADPSGIRPLALFKAARIDYSLHRLKHYTGTDPKDFQQFVLLTNYGFYIDEFIRYANESLAESNSDFVAFVEPSNGAHRVQMPAYHLQRADGSGISMVNIGVGPANAKNMTDHLAVLRPRAWLMLGHCAGLRDSQKLGDYVLAHAYVREDHVLDEELPLWIPVPALAEVQLALEQSVADITASHGAELKQWMRTGTVVTTDNRNWELLPESIAQRRFSQSRAIAVDMESATIAANGFRFRVPYGTLLCVSDKPLHGDIKLPGMANQFYRQRVQQHLQIGLQSIDRLRKLRPDQLHSRKLRSFDEVAFR